MGLPILCLDFDGVLHSYTSGWKGMEVIPDPPVQGAIEFLYEAAKEFDVQIFSSRSATAAGRVAMRSWLSRWDDEHWKGRPLPERPRTPLVLMVGFPISKPAAYVGLDDRVVTFEGRFPSVTDLVAFRPWWNRTK